MPSRKKYLSISYIVLQSLLIGLMEPALKIAYNSVPVYCFLTLRYLIAAAIMLLFWRRSIISEIKNVRVSKYIVPGICMAGSYVISNIALIYTTVTNVVFLRSLSALLVPPLLLLVYKKKYQKSELALQPLMLIGLYLLCARGGVIGFGLGEGLSVLSAAMTAGALVFGKEALKSVSAETLSFVQIIIAAIVCLPIGVASHSFTVPASSFSAFVILTIVYSAAATLGGYMLQNLALRNISAKVVGMLQSMYPVLAAAIAFFTLGERLSVQGLFGAAIIVFCAFTAGALKREDEAEIKADISDKEYLEIKKQSPKA